MQCVQANERCLDWEASNVHITKMRSVSLIRCLPKMSPSSSTSTGSQICTWRRSLTWTRHEFGYDLRPLSTGKMFVWPPAFLTEPGSARYSSAPSITTVWSTYQSSYITTSLKSIPQIRWLYHQMFKRCFHQFNSLNANATHRCTTTSLIIYHMQLLHLHIQSINTHINCTDMY